MSARKFRTNIIQIQAGGGDGNGFLSPTIYYSENPLLDDIQKTEDAANPNMDVDDARSLQHGSMSVLGTGDTADVAAYAAAIALGDAADAADDVDASSSSTPLSSSPTVNHVGTTGDNTDVEMEVEVVEDEGMEEEEAEEEEGEEHEGAQDPLGWLWLD